VRKMTRANLEAAFAGESQAHMKYLAFGDKAQKEGFPHVARLFRAVAYAEQVHATNHLRTLGDLGKTAENLEAAIGGEHLEIEELYPAFQMVAELQGERAAVRSNRWALEAEKIHAAMYDKAKIAVEVGTDVELGRVYVCSVCGWTGEGEPPDECPLCRAKKESFATF
jgi:rubrerythrin